MRDFIKYRENRNPSAILSCILKISPSYFYKLFEQEQGDNTEKGIHIGFSKLYILATAPTMYVSRTLPMSATVV